MKKLILLALPLFTWLVGLKVDAHAQVIVQGRRAKVFVGTPPPATGFRAGFVGPRFVGHPFAFGGYHANPFASPGFYGAYAGGFNRFAFGAGHYPAATFGAGHCCNAGFRSFAAPPAYSAVEETVTQPVQQQTTTTTTTTTTEGSQTRTFRKFIGP